MDSKGEKMQTYAKYLLDVSIYLKGKLEFEYSHFVRKVPDIENIKQENLTFLDKLKCFLDNNIIIEEEEINDIAKKLDYFVEISKR